MLSCVCACRRGVAAARWHFTDLGGRDGTVVEGWSRHGASLARRGWLRTGDAIVGLLEYGAAARRNDGSLDPATDPQAPRRDVTLAAMRRLCLLFVLGACNQDPVTPPDSSTPDDSSSSSAPSTTNTPTSTSNQPSGDTVDLTSTTSAPGETTTTADPTTAGDTTGGALPCGPPCDELRVFAGDMTIGSKTDPSAIRCVSRVEGKLEVEDQISDSVFNKLANLEVVTGALEIHDNPGLERLDALACLREAETVSLYDNPNLQSAAGLSGLRRTRSVHFKGDAALAELPLLDLDPASGLESVVLREMDALTSLDALAGLRFDAPYLYLYVEDCPALTSITGASDLLGSPGHISVELRDLPALPDLAGLGGANLGQLWLVRLALVDSLAPLQGLSSIDALSVHDLPLLASLHGLEDLGEAQGLYLSHLPLLADLGGLSGLTAVPGQLALSDLPLVADFTGLGSLVSVNELHIGDCHSAGGLAKITDLSGLDDLEVANNLAIGGNPKFASFAGAPKLQLVSEVHAVDNPQLTEATLTQWAASFDPDALTCIDACSCFAIDP